jgi:hypothetical protein
MKLAMAALALLLLGSASVARADGSGGDVLFEWTVSNLTFVGDNACAVSGSGTGTSPCIETFNISFEVDQADFTFNVVPGTESFKSSGPISGLGCCTDLLAEAGFAEISGGGAEFDFGPVMLLQTPLQIGTYAINGVIFKCPAGTCADDFFSGIPVTENNLNPPFGSGTLTISAMPEPPMLAMMFLGILPLAFVRRR